MLGMFCVVCAVSIAFDTYGHIATYVCSRRVGLGERVTRAVRVHELGLTRVGRDDIFKSEK